MRIGIIDLGTNSVRFDVYEQPEDSGPVERLHREKLMVRLGEDVFSTGHLSKEAIARALEAIQGFRKTADALNADKIVAVGTSALRDASDAAKFIQLIKKRTGIEIRIISGEEEARLIAHGVLENEPNLEDHFALVDIGGGSTEITICTDHTVETLRSLNIGVARIQQNFLPASPPDTKDTPDATRHLRRHIQKLLKEVFPQKERLVIPYLVGSSGTARALAKLLKKDGVSDTNSFAREALSKLVKKMIPLGVTELLALPGMEEKRVDLILGGSLLLEEIALFFNAKSVSVTDFSLRDGLLIEELQTAHKESQAKSTSFQLSLDNLIRTAIRFGAERNRTYQTAAIADALFERLSTIHCLGADYKRYLIAAAVFCQMGRQINPTQYQQHASYLARHLEQAVMHTWERELIALLCAKKSGGKIKEKHIPLVLSHIARQDMLKLLALLRLIDALTPFFRRVAAIRDISIDKRQIRIALSGRSNVQLELLRIDQRKELFEKLFGREVTVEPFAIAH